MHPSIYLEVTVYGFGSYSSSQEEGLFLRMGSCKWNSRDQSVVLWLTESRVESAAEMREIGGESRPEWVCGLNIECPSKSLYMALTAMT